MILFEHKVKENLNLKKMAKGYSDINVGLQWGDEGKGKIVNRLAPDYALGVRPHGGPNAGHSLYINGEEVVLNTIPCTIFSIPSLSGCGMVINPSLLVDEVMKVTKYGACPKDNFFLGNGAHLILPSHIMLDKAEEASKGADKIGSTCQGIGPVYKDKAGRVGIRVGDIFYPDFKDRVMILVEKHKAHATKLFNYTINEEEELNIPLQKFFEAVDFIRENYKDNCVNTSEFVNRFLDEGKNILSEGAQATMLDLQFGTYPYVTSSRCLASAVPGELGIPAQSVRKVFGITKAYTTRVGNGPFPTKIEGELEEQLRQAGHEFGARTGRPRATGWLDLPALRYACMINGVTDLVIVKADILDSNLFEKILICTHYELNGKKTDILNFDMVRESSNIKPVYKEFAGWCNEGTTKGCTNNIDLPKNASAYFEFIQKELNVPVYMISVGPEKDEIIIM